MTITREAFIEEARSWTGVPYVHQGRNRFGVDCIGLLLVTCWSLGLADYNVTGYGRTPNADFMLRECDRLMRRTTDPQPGDVLLMRFHRQPQHILILTEPARVIHAWADADRVVEVNCPPSWRRRVVASYRVPGVV